MRLSVAIPDSALDDESTKLEKTRKISQFGRCAAIFGARNIFVYRDGQNPADRSLMVSILRYMETPQFLRKRLYPKANHLKFAGVLQPLAIPSHSMDYEASYVRAGDIREGLAVTLKGVQYVDVGVDKLALLVGGRYRGRITVKFRKGYPEMEAIPVPHEDIPEYWGYAVRERSSVSVTGSGVAGRHHRGHPHRQDCSACAYGPARGW